MWKIAIATVGALLMACVPTDYTDADFRRVMSEPEFTGLVADKDLVVVRARVEVSPGSRIRMNSDGTLSGTFSKAKVSGRWEFKDGLYCSEVVLDGDKLPYECKEAWVAGPYLRLAGRYDPKSYAYYLIE